MRTETIDRLWRRLSLEKRVGLMILSTSILSAGLTLLTFHPLTPKPNHGLIHRQPDLDVAALAVRVAGALDSHTQTLNALAESDLMHEYILNPKKKGDRLDQLLAESCTVGKVVLRIDLYDRNGALLSEGCRMLKPLAFDDPAITITERASVTKKVIEERDLSIVRVAYPIKMSPVGEVLGVLYAELNATEVVQNLAAENNRGSQNGLSSFRRGSQDDEGSGLSENLMTRSVLGSTKETLVSDLGNAFEETASERVVDLSFLILTVVLFFALLRISFFFSRRIGAPFNALLATAEKYCSIEDLNIPNLHDLDVFERTRLVVENSFLQLKVQQERLEETIKVRTAAYLANKRKFKRILDSMPSLIYSADVSLAEVYYISPRLAEYFSKEIEDPEVYAEFRKAIQRNHRDRYEAFKAELIEVGEASFEYEIEVPSGGLRWFKEIARRVDEGDGGQVRIDGVISDITEMRIVEKLHLQARHDVHIKEAALDAITDGVLIVRNHGENDFTEVYSNQSFKRLLGGDWKEIPAVGKCLSSTDGGINSEALRLHGDNAHRNLIERKMKDGSEVFLEPRKSVMVDTELGVGELLVLTVRDVSETVRLQEKIFAWISKLDAIFTLNRDGVLFFDEESGITYANAASERLLSSSFGDLVGMTVEMYEEMLSHVCETFDADNRLLERDLKIDPAVICSSAAPSVRFLRFNPPSKTVVRQTASRCGLNSRSFVIYLQDVTREFALEEMKSEFLATAAHELRSPIASIMGFSELLLIRQYPAEKVREILSGINEQAVLVSALIDDLLDLARIEVRQHKAMTYSVEDASDAIRRVVSGTFGSSGREIHFIDDSDTSNRIRMDVSKFERALINLISNAIKFSDPSTVVQVRIRRDRAGFLGIDVIDHGIGMSREDAERAFERFFRAEKSGHIPGTGLGLSLVSEIVRLHGGSVMLDSELGRGTTVTLWFPDDKHDVNE